VNAKHNSIAKWLAPAAVVAALFAHASPARAQFTDPNQNIGVRPELLNQAGIDQKLNNQVPLNLTFRDEHGATVELGQFFTGKPVVLTLVYYNCPMLCTQVLNAVDRSMETMPLEIGKDFNVVTVSIDPSDRAPMADAKHAMYAGMYLGATGRKGAETDWHFLTGDEPQIKALADSVGFRYAYDPDSKQFAHASGIMVLTPEGKVSKYFYGVTYPARDLRLGLVDASQEKIGTVADQLLLYCYHYDPHTGKYGLIVSRALQLGGGATVLILGICVFFLFRGEHYELPRAVPHPSLGKHRA
jgi:protein SCO1/2